jgi:hypothetical protein
VLVVVVALTMGQGEAKPKDAFALIFAILGVFMVLLFWFQTRDLSAAEAADAAGRVPDRIDNPATLDEAVLYAAMAIGPIDADAVRARKQVWSTARSSIRLGMLITALIFLSVTPIYLLDTFVPILIGAPLIGGIALWKSGRLLAGGGELDQAYDSVDRAMAPLGLSLRERPTVTIEPKGVAPYRMGPAIHGALELGGSRHGRQVSVRMEGSKSEVRVMAASPPFEFGARDGRLKAEKDAPEAAAAALKSVPNSTRWNGVRGRAGADGIEAARKGGADPSGWLLDLWLAERLADAVDSGG